MFILKNYSPDENTAGDLRTEILLLTRKHYGSSQVETTGFGLHVCSAKNIDSEGVDI